MSLNADDAREARIQELGIKLVNSDSLEHRIALWSAFGGTDQTHGV
jgi:hypothetical protein